MGPAVAVAGGSPGPGLDGGTQRSFLSPTQPSPNMATGPVLPRSGAVRRGQSAGWQGSLLRKRLRCLQIPSDACGGSSYCGGRGQSPPGFLGGPPCRFQEPRAGDAGFPRVLDGQESAYNVEAEIKRQVAEAQAGIKIAGRNISNLRHADITTLLAESEEELKSLFTFCHKGGVICISEVIDISPSNLDSSLCFLQPSVSHDVLCI